MHADLQILMIAAVSIGALHTLTGPDHYLPFIALSRSRQWSILKTIAWTLICGSGHVLSSVLLGLGAAALGWTLSKISWLEEIRGGLAGWVMLCFGLLYTVWGLYRGAGHKPHKHFDVSEEGAVYLYEHEHGKSVTRPERYKLSPMVMFIIFVLGPCEPMIPLLYFPAAQDSWYGMLLLIIVYGFITLLTMSAMVLIGYYSAQQLPTTKLERWMHALCGFTIFVCGIGMLWLGW